MEFGLSSVNNEFFLGRTVSRVMWEILSVEAEKMVTLIRLDPTLEVGLVVRGEEVAIVADSVKAAVVEASEVVEIVAETDLEVAEVHLEVEDLKVVEALRAAAEVMGAVLGVEV